MRQQIQNKKGYDYLEIQLKDKCLTNCLGCASKMEVAAKKENFQRFEEKYGVKYINYMRR